jgi:hypothetical protein
VPGIGGLHEWRSNVRAGAGSCQEPAGCTCRDETLPEDMLLENPAFGTKARGLAENEKVLTRFFTSFPDYNVVLQGHAGNDDTLIYWGRCRRP